MMATPMRKDRMMAQKKARLKPSKKGTRDPKEWARKAREFNERLAAQGRYTESA